MSEQEQQKRTALVVTDVLNDYDHPDADKLIASAEELVERALGGKRPDLVEPVTPDPDDSFVLKLRHSVFYATPLEHLLREREVGRVILAGQVTEQCILYSALDARIREYEITIPRDAVAHIHDDLAAAALRMIELNLHGDVLDAEDAIPAQGTT